jgi:hypothetical protein
LRLFLQGEASFGPDKDQIKLATKAKAKGGI